MYRRQRIRIHIAFFVYLILTQTNDTVLHLKNNSEHMIDLSLPNQQNIKFHIKNYSLYFSSFSYLHLNFKVVR